MSEDRDSEAISPTSTGRAFVDHNAMVRFEFDAGVSVDEEAAIENMAATARAADNGKYRLILVDMREIKAIDAAARRYLSKNTGNYFAAVALLVRSPLSRVVANFFIGLNRTEYPVQLFTSEDAAVAWLRQATP